MSVAVADIKDVEAYWNRRPCNIRHSQKSKDTLEFYDDVAERRYYVEPHIPPFADFAAWKGKRVLEIGCGIGTDGIQFAKAGADYTGLDLSAESIAVARKGFELNGVKANLIHANGEEFDKLLPQAAFDLIYSFGVIHHTPYPGKIIESCRKVIKPNGTLKIMLYAEESWKSFMIEGGLDQPEAQMGCPIALTYTAGTVDDLLKGYFKTSKIEQDHIFPFVLEKYLKYEYEVLPWIKAMPPEAFAIMKRKLGWHLLITAAPV